MMRKLKKQAEDTKMRKALVKKEKGVASPKGNQASGSNKTSMINTSSPRVVGGFDFEALD